MAIVDPNSQAYQRAVVGIDALLQLAGEDPSREGLRGTPDRVVRAFLEMAASEENPESCLETIFTSDNDEMIVVRDIPFVSLCEHHLMPFWGTASIGYLPQEGKVLGLSKIPRLVEGYARRPQLQERLTQQIATALYRAPCLLPLGAGVVISATHSCAKFRGVRSSGEMVTSCLLGVLRESGPRAEFLSLVRAD